MYVHSEVFFIRVAGDYDHKSSGKNQLYKIISSLYNSCFNQESSFITLYLHECYDLEIFVQHVKTLN